MLLFIIYKDAIVYRLERKRDKLLAMELNKIERISQEYLKEKLLSSKFKERDDGYSTGSVRGQTLEETIIYIENNILGKGICYLPEAQVIYNQQQGFAKNFINDLKEGLL